VVCDGPVAVFPDVLREPAGGGYTVGIDEDQDVRLRQRCSPVPRLSGEQAFTDVL